MRGARWGATLIGIRVGDRTPGGTDRVSPKYTARETVPDE